jgi:Ca2+-binding RTX toxin-like protein
MASKGLVLTGDDQKDDNLQGRDGDDILTGLGGNDRLYGAGGKDILFGGEGDDRVDGGPGSDRMEGGRGNDTYVVDSLNDQIVETFGGAEGGVDRVLSGITFSLAALGNVENLTLTGTQKISGTGNGLDNIIVGNAVANTLTGGAGADHLDGGAGLDVLRGGVGNDEYIVNDFGDQVIETFTAAESGGIDTVISSVGFELGANVDNLTLTGSDNINGLGNELANVLLGTSGSNYLTGGAGADTLRGGRGDDVLDGGTGGDAMTGGRGSDLYWVDRATDVVTETDELANEGGVDTVVSTITYKLTNKVEDLILWGAGNIDGTGNTLDNKISGNDGVNVLRGGGGNDTLTGAAGDSLHGELGNDTLAVGSILVKEINGGSGNDTVNLDLLQTRLDLSGSFGAAIKDVEIIDLSGNLSVAGVGHANTLVLDASSIAALGEGNPTAVGAKTIVVTGDAGDRLILSLPDGWTSGGVAQLPYGLTGDFIKYSSGDATLLVENVVTTQVKAPTEAVPTLDQLDGTNGFTIDGIDRSFGF